MRYRKVDMSNTDKLITHAIRELAARPVVFSASDVAEYADLKEKRNIIEKALQMHCENQTIIRLNERHTAAGIRHCYLGMHSAKKWWEKHTIHLANIGVFCLTQTQLANAMSLAFDTHKWNVAPANLMDVGRRWAMVSDGYAADSFVFPWAMLLNTNPACKEIFYTLLAKTYPPSEGEMLSLDVMCDEVLSGLTTKEIAIIRMRFGLDIARKSTLEEVGEYYGVTRERIRQIEKKILSKLQHPSIQEQLWNIFAVDFLHSGGSLLFFNSSLSPHRKLLFRCINLKVIHIDEIKVQIIATKSCIADYLKILDKRDSLLPSQKEQAEIARVNSLRFLSQYDGEKLRETEKARAKRRKKTRAQMLHEGLLSLGRSAHYTEIAEKCNKLFPDDNRPTHNWHAALSYCSNTKKSDIVWVGTHGTYALKEHGYSRPEQDIYATVAEIVENKFAEMQEPVSADVVLDEMRNYRREFNPSSVKMALAFSKRLTAIRGAYIPKEFASNEPSKPQEKQYDIATAFAAFSEDSSDE